MSSTLIENKKAATNAGINLPALVADG